MHHFSIHFHLFLFLISTQTIFATKPPTACVTGATGFLGMELTSQLLNEGFHVRASVRDPSNMIKVQPLNKLAEDAKVPNHLTIVRADLMEGPDSFKECIKDAEYVFHTASPFQTKNIINPMKQLVEPALKGTEAVIGAALLQSSSVKYIVLTSSIAAVMSSTSTPLNKKCFTEREWNTKSQVENGGLDAYRYSKTVAEKRFWEMLEDPDLNTRNVIGTTILPSFIVGPQRSTTLTGESSIFMKSILEGQVPYRGNTAMCDVRDVAAAHIKAAINLREMKQGFPDEMEIISKIDIDILQQRRRYIISSEKIILRSDVLKWMSEKYAAQYQIAQQEREEEISIKRRLFCPTNLKEISMHIEDTKYYFNENGERTRTDHSEYEYGPYGMNMRMAKNSILEMASALLTVTHGTDLIVPIDVVVRVDKKVDL